MHRTSIASTRNSLGFVKSFDCIPNNVDETDASNSAIPNEDDAAFLNNASRMQHEISSIVVDNMFSFLSSFPSESHLCTTHEKVAPRRHKNSSFYRATAQQGQRIDVTESEDVTETTATVRSMSDAFDDVTEANRLPFDRVHRDDDYESSSRQSNEDASSITSEQEQQQYEDSTTLRIQLIEQMTSHFQNINLLKDACRTDHDPHHVDNASIPPMVLERILTYPSTCDDVTLVDEIDSTRFNANETLKNVAGGCHHFLPFTVDSEKIIMSIDRTYHESHQHLNSYDDIFEESNSDGCWTEEECGTATSTDLMVLPMVQDRKYKINRHNSHYPHTKLQQNQNVYIDNIYEDDHHSCANSSSSSGCTIHLCIRSCQSSVTWYEGSNIDEIDISCSSSDLDDDDATSLSSDDPEVYSTFT